MRYNDDVINAESWNTGIKKSGLPACPDSNEIAGHHTTEAKPLKTGPSEKNETAPITDKQPAGENLHVSNPDVIRISKMNASPASTTEPRNRINRRKKRGMSLLSGLLTGLTYRSRDHK